jgi:crossover junction endodeoxyribonuclease RusA
VSIVIAFPWPEPALWPNRAAKWWALARARKEAKRAGFFAVLEVKPELGSLPARLPITVRFCPSTRRRFDTDNALAALKGHFDGIAQALGIDDSSFEPITVHRGPVQKPGCVIVEIGT